MKIILIMGPVASGKSLILNALDLEYQRRGYKAVFFDGITSCEGLDEAAKNCSESAEFCVIASNNLTPDDFDEPPCRVIRTGRG